MYAGDLRDIGQHRHPGEQRRNQPLQAPHRTFDQGVRPADGHQPTPGLHHLPPTGSPPPAERQSAMRLHHQPLLDPLPA